MSEEFKEFVIDDTTYITKTNKKYEMRKKIEKPNLNEVKAFIPGTIREIYVKDGERVKENQPILILEAMKMRNSINAPKDGIINRIYFKSEDKVAKNILLFDFK